MQSETGHIYAKVSDYGIFTNFEPTEDNFAGLAPELLTEPSKVVLIACPCLPTQFSTGGNSRIRYVQFRHYTVRNIYREDPVHGPPAKLHAYGSFKAN